MGVGKASPSLLFLPTAAPLLRQKLLLLPIPSPNTNSIHASRRPLSTTPLSSDSKTNFAVEYLVKSCGVPLDKAIKASKHINFPKSPSGPDSVLQFLRESGISDAHIRAATSRSPLFLCASVDKNLKFRISELKEMGFSPSEISQLFAVSPGGFTYSNLQSKIKFLISILGSIEILLKVLEKNMYLLTSDHNKVIIPNVSFLKDHCGLSVGQMSKLVKTYPRLITSNPDTLKGSAQRAKKFGIEPCDFYKFLHALNAMTQNESKIDDKLRFLRSLGCLDTEVIALVRKNPRVLAYSKEKMRRIMEFLIKEVGVDTSNLGRNLEMLYYSLEGRLVPRNFVLKTLRSKGLLKPEKSFTTCALLTEKKFEEEFVIPYKGIIPGFYETYISACSGEVPIDKKI